MRLLTAISVASLVVSIAALVFVLGLYAELEKSEPETPKEHTQELNQEMVGSLMNDHVAELIESAGITADNHNDADFQVLLGYGCFWEKGWDGYHQKQTYYPHVYGRFDNGFNRPYVTFNYIKTYDIWMVTSSVTGCQGVETWVIDDNTGEVTYGHPDEKSVEN